MIKKIMLCMGIVLLGADCMAMESVTSAFGLARAFASLPHMVSERCTAAKNYLYENRYPLCGAAGCGLVLGFVASNSSSSDNSKSRLISCLKLSGIVVVPSVAAYYFLHGYKQRLDDIQKHVQSNGNKIDKNHVELQQRINESTRKISADIDAANQAQREQHAATQKLIEDNQASISAQLKAQADNQNVLLERADKLEKMLAEQKKLLEELPAELKEQFNTAFEASQRQIDELKEGITSDINQLKEQNACEHQQTREQVGNTLNAVADQQNKQMALARSIERNVAEQGRKTWNLNNTVNDVKNRSKVILHKVRKQSEDIEGMRKDVSEIRSQLDATNGYTKEGLEELCAFLRDNPDNLLYQSVLNDLAKYDNPVPALRLKAKLVELNSYGITSVDLDKLVRDCIDTFGHIEGIREYVRNLNERQKVVSTNIEGLNEKVDEVLNRQQKTMEDLIARIPTAGRPVVSNHLTAPNHAQYSISLGELPDLPGLVTNTGSNKIERSVYETIVAKKRGDVQLPLVPNCWSPVVTAESQHQSLTYQN